MASNNVSTGGVNVVGLLGVVFVVLKLCGVINWSWWWVTAPFWAGFVIFGVIAIIAGIVFAIANGIDSVRRAKRHRQYVERNGK